MKPNIHPELYRAMQAAREEDISRVSRAAARGGAIAIGARGPRGAGEPSRSSNVRSGMHQRPLLRPVDAPTNIHVNVPPLTDKPPLPK